MEHGLPTSAKPGTEEKITVLSCRANARQILFHPDDARMDSDFGFDWRRIAIRWYRMRFGDRNEGNSRLDERPS